MLQLPETHIAEVCEYLHIRERRLALGTCTSLWRLRHDLEERIRSLQISEEDAKALMIAHPHDIGRQLFFSRLIGLGWLDLGSWATDEFLSLIAGGDGSELLENLYHIGMVGSKQVTDLGLMKLSRGEARAKKLRSVDITFCRSTSYCGTFPLRERLQNLDVIRRQPEWLDGQYLTPFGGSSDGNVEDHTYWADGTFSFNRSTQSSGFVCDLFELGCAHHVGDKLQYSNFAPPLGWPAWSRYCYRPGVSLLRLPDESDQGERLRSVLVAQRLAGTRAPSNFPVPEHVDVVPMGESRYFGRDGDLLPEGSTDQYIMVSRMHVNPLPNGKLMPPDELVQQNRELCEAMKASRELEILDGEEILHMALLGR